MRRVVFDPDTALRAAFEGVKREYENVSLGRQHRAGCPFEQGWSNHIEGAMAECALAMCLGEPWNPAPLGKHDVAGMQCRMSTCRFPSGPEICMPLHSWDDDSDRYWLVVGSHGTYDVIGTIIARDGKRKEWWRKLTPDDKRPPAYWVPSSALEPVEEWLHRNWDLLS